MSRIAEISICWYHELTNTIERSLTKSLTEANKGQKNYSSTLRLYRFLEVGASEIVLQFQSSNK